jgi:hypothetical protein
MFTHHNSLIAGSSEPRVNFKEILSKGKKPHNAARVISEEKIQRYICSRLVKG